MFLLALTPLLHLQGPILQKEISVSIQIFVTTTKLARNYLEQYLYSAFLQLNLQD